LFDTAIVIMTSIDELFRKPNLPSSHAQGKRKFEATDAHEVYKSAKLSSNSDAKGKSKGAAHVEDAEDDDTEAGPEPPPEDETGADDEGRFFGGGVTRNTTDALDYLEDADGEELEEEKMDTAWVRRLVTNLGRKITLNSEQRAKFEDSPQKFMASEADLDAEIKSLSILTEHDQFYTEFTQSGGAAHLVSLLAHENTDIAINAIEIIAELIDEDVQAEQDQWDTLVEAMLEADLVGLLASNLDRLHEQQHESDRQGVYHSLAVLEGLASQANIVERIGHETVIKYLLKRIRVAEAPVGQNQQYAAEVLQVLLQTSSVVRRQFIKLEGVDTLLQLLSAYRKKDPEKDSHEEEYVEDLFDALTCVVDETDGKHAFVHGEGMELMLIMLKEGKLSKARGLNVIDHATGRHGQEVCERLVDAAGLKTIFSVFMKKPENAAAEHLLGIFSALLRCLPGESASRIRTLGKFVEKEYEKIGRLLDLRTYYAARVAAVDAEIATEQESASEGQRQERATEWYSRRLDAGLYCLRTVNVVLAWLAAEDMGAKQRIIVLLAKRGEKLGAIRSSLDQQLTEMENNEDEGTAEMLNALKGCL